MYSTSCIIWMFWGYIIKLNIVHELWEKEEVYTSCNNLILQRLMGSMFFMLWLLLLSWPGQYWRWCTLLRINCSNFISLIWLNSMVVIFLCRNIKNIYFLKLMIWKSYLLFYYLSQLFERSQILMNHFLCVCIKLLI